MPATKEDITKLIASDKVVIFSKTFCPYCTKAKKIFDDLKQAYTAIELDERDDMSIVQDILEEITGERTVPRIFIDQESIGGCSDLQKLNSKGELVKKL